MVNISYIECSDDVRNVYYETIEPRFYSSWHTLDELEILVKDSRKQFSPFKYKNNTKSVDNWNNNDQNSLWFDFDDGLSIEEATKLFKHYKFLIYTTKSHQKDKKGLVCDRFRMVLPAINIPTGELYWAMMRELEKLLPIDKQVNTPTGSFLGYSEAKTYINDGDVVYDCSYLLDMAEYRLANKKKSKELKHKRRMEKLETVVYDLNVQDIKNYLEIEDCIEILNALGFEVNEFTKKFKLREEERTHSAKIYANGYIYDYGSGFKGDILDVIQDTLGLSFKESMKYVEQYLKDKNGQIKTK